MNVNISCGIILDGQGEVGEGEGRECGMGRVEVEWMGLGGVMVVLKFMLCTNGWYDLVVRLLGWFVGHVNAVGVNVMKRER
jgi:hypothetical protein